MIPSKVLIEAWVVVSVFMWERDGLAVEFIRSYVENEIKAFFAVTQADIETRGG